MIDGVKVIPRTRHADDRGYVTEILRSDDDHFLEFGQAYITTCRKGVIKAWHKHAKQTDFFYVVGGTMKIGLHDAREDSPTKGEYQVEVLGEQGNDSLLVIPPDVCHGMMGLAPFSALLNIPTERYDYDDPDELRAPWDAFDDIWSVNNR